MREFRPPGSQPLHPSSKQLAVREGSASDSAEIAILLGELGYPSSAADVVSRIGRLTSADYAVRVAEMDGRVVGLLCLHSIVGLHASAPSCYLTALVVSASARRSGVGRHLLEAARAWAVEKGCNRLMLTTANHRHDAHAFYDANGFTHTGRRFVKTL